MPKAKLCELSARHLGVISDAQLEFGDGFNVLTGETGAGKTLLLGALELCLGDDAAPRHALSTETRVSSIFVTSDGVERSLVREVTPAGRLRGMIDGVGASAEALRNTGRDLIVIHGQHDSLRLRQKNEVLRLIDDSGSVDTGELASVRRRLDDISSKLMVLGGDAGQRERERDLIAFQVSELRDVAISGPTELSDSLEELTRLTELRDGQAALHQAVEGLDGDSETAALPLLAQAIRSIPVGMAYDGARQILREALEMAREAVSGLGSLLNPETAHEAQISILEARVAALSAIARKYGGTLEAAAIELERLSARLHELENAEESLQALEREAQDLHERERALARKARSDREFAAAKLTEAIRAQLPRVALGAASLRFAVDGDDGSDVQILFRPNPGLPEGPLASLASGGELSRVLLALSLETTSGDVVAVFDEVDAGVGGQTAQQIGSCLSELGGRQQVLAITHLASVAARADHHFVVEKTVIGGITQTAIRRVSGDERVREIARMLSGESDSVEALALARRLLVGE